MSDNERLNVSLEPHLQDALASIHDLTPPKLAEDLAPYLSSERDPTTVDVIPYPLLQKISRWSQTLEGTKTLQGCSPQLDPQSYTMISLLAGTRTSPEKHFPPYIPSDPLEEHRRAIDDRKAISAVMNAVLSVVGTGAATWWASDRTGLKLEWVSRILLLRVPQYSMTCTPQRALLAVSTAVVVALAEIVLYTIWDSRKRSKLKNTRRHAIATIEKDGKDINTGDIPVLATGMVLDEPGLRHRNTRVTDS